MALKKRLLLLEVDGSRSPEIRKFVNAHGAATLDEFQRAAVGKALRHGRASSCGIDQDALALGQSATRGPHTSTCLLGFNDAHQQGERAYGGVARDGGVRLPGHVGRELAYDGRSPILNRVEQQRRAAIGKNPLRQDHNRVPPIAQGGLMRRTVHATRPAAYDHGFLARQDFGTCRGNILSSLRGIARPDDRRCRRIEQRGVSCYKEKRRGISPKSVSKRTRVVFVGNGDRLYACLSHAFEKPARAPLNSAGAPHQGVSNRV